MISDALAARVLAAALETGGDFSELFLEDTEVNNISMLDGNVETATYARSRGVGVRVFMGSKSAYAYTSLLDEQSLINTARAAAAILIGKGGACVTPFGAFRDYAKNDRRVFSDITNDMRIELMQRATRAARAISDEITKIPIRYSDKDRRIEIYNSEGLHVADRQPRTRMAISVVASNGEETQTGFEGPGRAQGFEVYKGVIDVESAARAAAKSAVTMLHGRLCPAKSVPVVIDGGFGGVILHEACVHALEATAVAKGNSVFCGMLDKKIASDIVTAVDDGTMPGEWGSVSIDDEGTPTKRNVLIENGVLKTYLVDRLNARKMNHPITGSSRRQDYSYAPTSRMTNTFFAPGKDDDEEMIRSMGEGLFAAKMGGGSVNPVTGEFNFAVDEGYWVKNGEIVCPVRGATLIGKGAEVLMKIDRIGKRMWQGQGMCGSLSGYVPTNVGQPRIRVSEILVGGKGGDI